MNVDPNILEENHFYLVKKHPGIYFILKVDKSLPTLLQWKDQFGQEVIMDNNDVVMGSMERIEEYYRLRKIQQKEYYEKYPEMREILGVPYEE